MELTMKPSIVHRLLDGDLLVVQIPRHAHYGDEVEIQNQLENLRKELKRDHRKRVYFLLSREDVKITHFRAVEEVESAAEEELKFLPNK